MSPLRTHEEGRSPGDREIDQLCERFRQGDSDAAEDLLRRFHPLIQAYYRFALTGRLNPGDRIMMGFAGAYGSNPAEGALNFCQRLSAVSKEDIYQELVLVFLECARRASNLQYAFRRDALRRLAHMAHGANFPVHLEDLLDRLGNGEIDTESEVPCEHQKVVPMALRSDGGFRSSEGLWVLGVQDETDLFAEFDTVERELLVLRYLHHVDWRSLRRRYGRSVVDGCLAKIRRLRSGRTGHSTKGSNASDTG